MFSVASGKTTADSLGNFWTLVGARVPLEVSVSDPLRRIKLAHQRLQRIKQSNEALWQARVENLVLTLLPDNLFRRISYNFFRRHTALFSSIPGPVDFPVFVGEQQVQEFIFLFSLCCPS